MCEVRIFLSAPNNHDRFFFLHTLWSPAFDFNVEVEYNESDSYTLTSAILQVDAVCDVATTLLPKVLTTDVTSYTASELTTRVVIRFLSIPLVGYVR